MSTAAHHANEAMKKIHKFKKLLEIQDLVGGVIDLVSPSRELLKEGKINKISARSGDTQERHLFVVSTTGANAERSSSEVVVNAVAAAAAAVTVSIGRMFVQSCRILRRVHNGTQEELGSEILQSETKLSNVGFQDWCSLRRPPSRPHSRPRSRPRPRSIV